MSNVILSFAICPLRRIEARALRFLFMRKNVFGRHFKRDANERKSLFKGLISSLILEERIQTTEAKAKAIKGLVDRVITHAKKGESAAQFLRSYLPDIAINKVISQIAPRFGKRKGGYTRIIRLGRRFSDRASMVFLELVEGEEVKVVKKAAVKKIKKGVEK